MPAAVQITPGPARLLGRQNGGGLLGPLTTTFTRPADCTKNVRNLIPYECSDNGSPALILSCLPSFRPEAPQVPAAYYSPGFICPQGMITACLGGAAANSFPDTGASISGFNASYSFPFAVGSEQSIAGCCPSGFTCNNNDANCASSVSRSQTLTVGTCSGSSRSEIISTVSAGASGSVHANRIHLVWQARDLSPTSNETTSTLSSSDPTSTHADSGTPAGPIAGGVVGGVFALLLLVLLPYFLLRARRKKKVGVSGPELPELPHDEKPRYEKDDQGERFELPTNDPTPEMHGDEPLEQAAAEQAEPGHRDSARS